MNKSGIQRFLRSKRRASYDTHLWGFLSYNEFRGILPRNQSRFTPCFRASIYRSGGLLTLELSSRQSELIGRSALVSYYCANDIEAQFTAVKSILARKTEHVLFRRQFSGAATGGNRLQNRNGSGNCVKASFQISITAGSPLRRENHRGIMYLLSSITGSTAHPRAESSLSFVPAARSL